MGVIESLAGRPRISIEVVPPARGGDLEEIMAAVRAVMPHDPAFVSVTDHAEGRAWVDSDGRPARVALRTKPGTLGTAVALRDAFHVQTMPHLVCVGAERLATEDLLIDLHYAGFRDLFVVRGDERFVPEGMRVPAIEGCGPGQEGYSRAVDMVAHIASLNRGEYTPPSKGRPTAFAMGVAGYPQKHYAAPNMHADLLTLKAKAEAGAGFVVTQMVFESERYASYVAALRDLGVTLPVIPGIKPLLRASQIESIPRNFHVDIPRDLVEALSEARTPAEERKAGTEWAARLASRLLEAGAPCLHFFTMGSGAGTRAVLDALFGARAG